VHAAEVEVHAGGADQVDALRQPVPLQVAQVVAGDQAGGELA